MAGHTMKRAGGLWEKICEPENLRLAFWKAAKGKRDRDGVRHFSENLDAEIGAMRAGLLAGDFPVGRFSRFKVYEPKERTIHAAAFPERVLHHAIFNVGEPYFEQWLIADTFACRRGKGQFAAIARAREFAGRYGWFLKMDVRRCFESLSHDVLLELLARKFREPELLALFGRIVRCHEAASGRGLPIGSLTSQHFANAYLGLLDRFVKDKLRCVGYVRYMDDFVVWADDKTELRHVREEVRGFLRGSLALEFKIEPCPQRTVRGMDFLGFRIFPQTTRLARRSKRRFARRCRAVEQAYAAGRITLRRLQAKVTALLAFVAHAESLGFRLSLFHPFGDGPQGSNRVNRGGSWNNTVAHCRAANRNTDTPSNRNNNLGFRLALAPQLNPPAEAAG